MRGSKPGERRGGRKKGTPNQRTAEQRQAVTAYIEQHVEERDVDLLVDPIDALCELTHWAMQEFRACSKAIDSEGNPIPELIALKAKLGLAAADWAAKAAPYLRPRLNAVEARVNVNVTIYERIERSRQRLAIAA